MHPKYFLAILVFFCVCTAHAATGKQCASTVNELRVLLGDQNLPLHWKEVGGESMTPLMVDIHEQNGGLLLKLSKSEEGLWAESVGAICQSGAAAENQFIAEQVRLGPAASWLLRQVISPREIFTLTRMGSTRLRIAAGLWDGNFRSTDVAP